MAAPKNTPQPGEPSRQQMMRVLIPAGAIAVIVILVAVLVAAFDGNPSGDGKGKGKGKGGYAPPTGGTDVSKMSDGSDPVAEDLNLQPIGTQGLKFRDLKEGDGDVIKPGQRVTAYYTGWLTNGKVFDSSRRKGEPIPFGLDEVIKGWGLGIPGMKVGGIRKLVIPSDLGYGARGAGRDIPPNSTLIFEVEIVDVQ